jgi:hypothetical protein
MPPATGPLSWTIKYSPGQQEEWLYDRDDCFQSATGSSPILPAKSTISRRGGAICTFIAEYRLMQISGRWQITIDVVITYLSPLLCGV